MFRVHLLNCSCRTDGGTPATTMFQVVHTVGQAKPISAQEEEVDLEWTVLLFFFSFLFLHARAS